MECKPNPLIKLRILCNAQCGSKVASLAAFGAHFVAKSSHPSSATYAAN
jgi:hypothetical protein